MNEARNEYNTKQRQALLDFFKAHREGQFTVAQIADAVCAEAATATPSRTDDNTNTRFFTVR